MTMKLPNDFDHFWEGSKKPKSCPWTLQKSCWQLLSIIPGDQTLLARYCKKANTLQSSRSSPGKKVLIGHRCSHPGDGGKKIGDPSPVHMRPSTKVAIQNDGNLWIHGCPPKVAIQNNGNLGPLASRSKKRLPIFFEAIARHSTFMGGYRQHPDIHKPLQCLWQLP